MEAAGGRGGGGGGGVEGFEEAATCHVLKGQHRVYLRSHRTALSRSAERDAIFTAAHICTLAAWERCRDSEFLMELPALSQAVDHENLELIQTI